jgi:hypothetical protein
VGRADADGRPAADPARPGLENTWGSAGGASRGETAGRE